ncbi:MAG: hypothetical protein MIL41_01220 [Hyphomicrobiales bacterium]|jgi:hypothetical protein
MTNLDLDRLADLRLCLRHTRGADPELGCAIIALLLPGTIAAAAADTWLAQPGSAIDRGLDITGSVDDALRLLGQLGFGPGWSITRTGLYDDTGLRAHDRYGVSLHHRFFHCLASGPTAATALVDMAIHATVLGAAGYEEEETILLSAADGAPQTHDSAAVADPVEDWSDDPKERTRQVVDEFWPNLNAMGCIYLKNSDGRFGATSGYELEAGIFRVVDRDEARSERYDSVESLLAAGWVLA